MLAYVPGNTVQAAEEVTLFEDPSLHVAVAVYDAEEFSETVDGLPIVNPVRVAATFTTVTVADAVRVAPPEV
jgi:hypothetical protein